MKRPWVVPTLLACVATVGWPCGGAQVYLVDGPLVTAVTFAERALAPFSDLDVAVRDEIRFLPGLVAADSSRFAPLLGRPPLAGAWWDTTARPRVPEPTSGAMLAAWARGDVSAATEAARSVVARVMALPVRDDSARDATFRLAVASLELAPLVSREPVATRQATFLRLAGPLERADFGAMSAALARDASSPRRATMAYAALRERVRTTIPDGSRDDLASQVPAARWDSLQAAHREWLATWPTHPYAGLVRFARLRLFFLASQSDSAWRTGIALMSEYPARAAADLRYLLAAGMVPPQSILDDASVPIEVRASLVGNLRPSSSAWSGLRRDGSRLASPAARMNLDERLLAILATDSVTGALPADFPQWNARATPLWRYLFTVNVLRARRLDAAVPFTETPIVPRDDSLLAADASRLAARVHLARREWSRAVQVTGLDEWTRRYILRVLAPDSVAPALLGAADRGVVRDARLVVASRAAHANRWDEAATLVRSVDGARAALYTKLGALARDTISDAGLYRFAQAMAAANGKLFYESSRYFHRGMMYRDYALAPDRTDAWDLPWSRADERRWLYAYLRDGSERWLSLQAIASYLNRRGITPAQRRFAVREGDRTYRALLATDPSNSDSGYWADSLPSSAAARAIRRAGRR